MKHKNRSLVGRAQALVSGSLGLHYKVAWTVYKEDQVNQKIIKMNLIGTTYTVKELR